MARYTGPKTKIARKFRDPIYGPDKSYDKKNYPPGHMVTRDVEGSNQNMVSSCRKNKKQNILTECLKDNLEIYL